MFIGIHGRCRDNIYNLIHLLIHADDVTLLAVDRKGAIGKLRTLSCYCRLNYIIPQITKCKFVMINGDGDDLDPLPLGDCRLNNVDYLEILGSHISSSGSLDVELDLHMEKRFKSCIKYFNFCRENKLAPVSVRIKTLKACVMSSLLYNCETFGSKLPKSLETLYNKLIRSALQVRANTPTLLLYIESGLLPIKALIEARQFNFFKRFESTLLATGDRKFVFDQLASNPSKFMKHYQLLVRKYSDSSEIYSHHIDQVKLKIRNYALQGKYKYEIYLKYNPELKSSPFIDCMHPLTTDIIRFRVGSHCLPIEKGRWSRQKREDRICVTCNVLGDEAHVLYNCSLISRDDLTMSNDLSSIWVDQDIFKLFGRIKMTDYL